ncbi:MAG: hypothetical protein BGO14_11445 [Chlamydiales bacterium 38-26]|nr:DUF1761 domain-containing protein [Chlamydiales bacterium]OJV11557.1 MAG: hypothetical protein BGO14_11445 [Chlamydiales bacterium 38-26]
MEPTNVNIWVVLTCTLINLVLGMVWYSPNVLGNLWAQEHGFTSDQLKASIWHYLGAIIVAFIMSYVLDMIMHTFGVRGIGNGIALGFFIWLGFIATTHFSGVIWAKKPFIVFFIDAGYLLFNLILIGAIMGAWQ